MVIRDGKIEINGKGEKVINQNEELIQETKLRLNTEGK